MRLLFWLFLGMASPAWALLPSNYVYPSATPEPLPTQIFPYPTIQYVEIFTTPTQTFTVTPTLTVTQTATTTPTGTATGTASPTITITATPTPSFTVSMTPTYVVNFQVNYTPPFTAVPYPTQIPLATVGPTNTPIVFPTPLPWFTQIPLATVLPTATPIAWPTPVPYFTAAVQFTATTYTSATVLNWPATYTTVPTATPIFTATAVPTATAPPTFVPYYTQVVGYPTIQLVQIIATASPTFTFSPTLTQTFTTSPTPTPTPTISATPTIAYVYDLLQAPQGAQANSISNPAFVTGATAIGNIKNTGAVLMRVLIMAFGGTTNTACVHIYNSSTAPVTGTATNLVGQAGASIGAPGLIDCQPQGCTLTTGLSYSITGNIAPADTAAATCASSVVFVYK